MRGVDVDVAPGEIFGFLGPNGAGKSSTMRMIACVSPRSDGALQVLGMDPDVDGPRIRARIGVVPQLDNLDTELTVRENLEVYGRYFGLSRAHVRSKAVELMEFAQLADRADAAVESLSGGMKRRLTIARSLVNDPELLLLDEPTTGLDPQARHLLWDRLYRLKGEGRHPDRHHALHGRGRAAVRPAGGDGRRGDRRRGLAGRADRPVLHARGAGAAVPAGHRRPGRGGGAARRARRGAAGPPAALHLATASTCRPSCARRGVRPLSALVRRSSLEDVFLRLTGRSLVD